MQTRFDMSRRCPPTSFVFGVKQFSSDFCSAILRPLPVLVLGARRWRHAAEDRFCSLPPKQSRWCAVRRRTHGIAVLSDVHAAVRFEVRLAEDKPAPGLRAAVSAGSERPFTFTMRSSSPIAISYSNEGGRPSEYRVDVEFIHPGCENARSHWGPHQGSWWRFMMVRW